jgi:hypothetical protein
MAVAAAEVEVTANQAAAPAALVVVEMVQMAQVAHIQLLAHQIQAAVQVAKVEHINIFLVVLVLLL